MTEKVTFDQNYTCDLHIKGNHIELGSLRNILLEEFKQFCQAHKYHPTTTTIKVDKCKETSAHFTITIDTHLNKQDFRGYATDPDHHKAMKDAFHMLQNNITHH